VRRFSKDDWFSGQIVWVDNYLDRGKALEAVGLKE
jgi:hypothetical protein